MPNRRQTKKNAKKTATKKATTKRTTSSSPKAKNTGRNPFTETARTKSAAKTGSLYGMKRAEVKEGESLESAWKRLAKQADQRLVRLEAYAHDKGMSNVLRFAYAGAMRNIKAYGGTNRFNAKKPKNANELKARINDLLTFLNSPTSTKQGILKTHKKRADSLNEKFGTNFTWEEMSDYFQSGMAETLTKKYGSDVALLLIAKEQREVDVSQIRKEVDKHKHTANQDEQNKAIYERLASQKLDAKTLRTARAQAKKIAKARDKKKQRK